MSIFFRVKRFISKEVGTCFVFGLGFIFSFLVFQVGVYVYAGKYIDIHTNSLLRYAEDVAMQQVNAISSAEGIKETECSEDNQKKLKIINFQSQYIKDVGKLKDGQVICSALWGGRGLPYKLSHGRVTKNGFTIWDGFSGFEVFNVLIDLTAIGTSFVVTSPDTFSLYKNVNEMLLEIVESQNNKTLHSFGINNPSIGWFNQKRIACSKHFDFCVKGQKDSSLLKPQNKRFFETMLFLGSLIGFLFALLYKKRTVM